jgi:hypothetical protein
MVQTPAVIITDPAGMDDIKVPGIPGFDKIIAESLQDLIRYGMSGSGPADGYSTVAIDMAYGLPDIDMFKHSVLNEIGLIIF